MTFAGFDLFFECPKPDYKQFNWKVLCRVNSANLHTKSKEKCMHRGDPSHEILTLGNHDSHYKVLLGM